MTVEAAKDLGLIFSGSKTEYMTANRHPQPSLHVYGEPINHVTDFKYLGSKMAPAASDFKRLKVLAWSAFWMLNIFSMFVSPRCCQDAAIGLYQSERPCL